MRNLLLLAFALVYVTLLSARPVTASNVSAGPFYIAATDTLELYDTIGNKINDGTLTITSTNLTADVLVGHIWIKNTTTTNLTNAYVVRTINQEVSGTMNTFCFGNICYGPSTNQSISPATLLAGVLDKSFYADYYPMEQGGLTSITYEFFDNTTLSAPVREKATVKFLLSAVGVATDKFIFKGPYPNPSSQLANFEYNFPTGSENSQVIIRNILGVEVENISLDNRSGKKSVDVSNYPSGIYFYTLMVDGKVIQSKKMIVKH